MTTKTVAWTKETTAKLIAAYGKGETTLKELSAMFGKSEAAIRGKLVSEKVYVKKTVEAKTSTNTAKTAYVNAIRILTGLNGLDSLVKASESDLEKLATYLTNKF